MSIVCLLLSAALLCLPDRPIAAERLRALLPFGAAAPHSDSALAVALPRVGGYLHQGWGRCTARWRKVRPPADLPRVLDLLGVTLASGMPPHAALAAVAEALDSPSSRCSTSTQSRGRRELAEALREVSGRLQLGAEPREAHADEVLLGPLGSVLARSAHSGGGMRPALEHAAARLRSEVDAAAVARAERAGVLVTGPLGLCFLPAFVCLGIVPVILGLAAEVLPGVTP